MFCRFPETTRWAGSSPGPFFMLHSSLPREAHTNVAEIAAKHAGGRHHRAATRLPKQPRVVTSASRECMRATLNQIRFRRVTVSTMVLFFGMTCAHAWHFPYSHHVKSHGKTVADTNVVCQLCLGSFASTPNVAFGLPATPDRYSFIPVDGAAPRPSSGRNIDLFIRPPPFGSLFDS